jgi:holo-[acyl-carrier protein] synthase
MIQGIGIDTVEIDRFALWHTYSVKKLQRIFSSEEIEYCLQDHKKSAERFAARFAAREALYKALSFFNSEMIPFLTLCSHITIKKIDQRPILELDSRCGIDLTQFKIHLSLSHSRMHATALVLIEER